MRTFLLAIPRSVRNECAPYALAYPPFPLHVFAILTGATLRTKASAQ